MQQFHFAHDSLKNLNLATQMKNISDPAIVLRIERALAMSTQLAKLPKLQAKEKTKIQQIQRVLQEIADLVPHSAQLYRKEIFCVIAAFSDVLTGQKTSRASSRLKAPRKTAQNEAIYEDLIMQHVELEDMNAEIKNLKNVVKQQEVQLKKQNAASQENIQELENTFRTQSFKDRRETVKIASKFDEIQRAKEEVAGLQARIQEIQTAHVEEKLVSKLKMTEIEGMLQRASMGGEFGMKNYESGRENYMSGMKNENQFEIQTRNFNSSSTRQNNSFQASGAQTSCPFTSQLLQIVLSAEFPETDTPKLRSLRVQAARADIQKVLQNFENEAVLPLQNQIQETRNQLQQANMLIDKKERDYALQNEQIANQSMLVEKLRYENAQLHQRVMESDKELFGLKLSRTYQQ
ncbi:hypothetical protein SS50377_23842 [Spironucleus salmonicida]|uniref:Uncharacterized protein n=1 Tax=Spironucleus salmonicida TaxID=348837 RepID=V6LTN0_9EUKA|nr:hypothetical protein SS50377_23842 [Spironucleus salmonicida]|eukprot:EST44144.1 Hypothetical protein SS50377_16045 [Spironucleus salmonicida]